MTVHLPTKKPMKQLQSGRQLKYEDLLAKSQAHFDLIDPSPELMQSAESSLLDDLISKRNRHSSTVGSKVIEEIVTNVLLNR